MIGINISEAIKYLKEDNVVGIPTETVYGLAGNALSEVAVSRIFSVKKRPFFDPLIVHCYDLQQARSFTYSIPEQLQILADEYMPGPLTLLLKKKENIPDIVTSSSKFVAIRIPNHPLTLSLLSQIDFPIAAPSANPFGYISPTTALHVESQLGLEVPYILDGGSSNVGIESTIVGMDGNEVTIFRKGGLSIPKIEEMIGKVKVNDLSTSNPKAPGTMISHYAPKIPMRINTPIEELLNTYDESQIGIIAFSEYAVKVPHENQIILSHSKNFEEAARNLFSGMRKLDEKKLKVIWAELLPEEDLGIAINDRLRRASAK